MSERITDDDRSVIEMSEDLHLTCANWTYFIQPDPEQNCWVCFGAGNLRSIKRLELYKE